MDNKQLMAATNKKLNDIRAGGTWAKEKKKALNNWPAVKSEIDDFYKKRNPNSATQR